MEQTVIGSNYGLVGTGNNVTENFVILPDIRLGALERIAKLTVSVAAREDDGAFLVSVIGPKRAFHPRVEPSGTIENVKAKIQAAERTVRIKSV
ncbi:hypothetical protein RvY_02278 [Ramazzottius varieornatus]|uniref:Uncharacterized protein n=1 Tax=Ramazzottius varieornatus TaxID=947166 RepID=A0A1D1UR87_RAMVA|nr:hypothetical protein RvY_02278 [Ramazzottius varieornatus]